MSRVLLDFGPSNVGLQPGFVQFKDLYALTTVIASPVVYEIGGGTYYFDVVFPLAASATTTSVVYKATCNGVGRSGVVSEQPQNTNSGPLRAVFDLGLDSSGQVPQFINFDDFDTLEALDDPTIVEIGSGLYYFEYEFPVPESPTTTEIVYVASSPVANPLSLSPATGSTAGGDSVTITGTNFRAGATVTFGGGAATVGVITSTTIAVTTPAHVVGTVDVVVSNVDCPPATLTDAFTYEVPETEFWIAGTIQAGVIWSKPLWVNFLNVWVAVGTDSGSGDGMVAQSADRITWSVIGTAPTAGGWNCLAENGSLVVIAGASGGGTPFIYTTPNLVTWTSRTAPATLQPNCMCANGTAFFIAGTGGANASASSPTGVVWTARSLPTVLNEGISSAAANGTDLVVVGTDGGGVIDYSTNNGATWASTTPPGGVIYSIIIHDGTQFIAAGTDAGTACVAGASLHGSSWSALPIPANPAGGAFPSTNYTCIAYDTVRVAVTADSGAVVTSTDHGATWATHAGVLGVPLQAIAGDLSGNLAGVGEDLALYNPEAPP